MPSRIHKNVSLFVSSLFEIQLLSENFELENVMNYPTYYGEKSIWLILQIFYFSFVLSTCHIDKY